MDLKKLEYLDSIYRLRNFTKAAEEQYISQPSISSAIQSLEDELDVVLINRNTRPLSFTDAGEEFMEYVHNILKEVKHAEDAMKHRSRQNHESLRIALYSSSTSQLIPKIYMDFHSHYPQCELKITENTLTAMLRQLLSGELDMAYTLVPDDIDQNLFKILPVELCELWVILSSEHPLAQESVISLEQLTTERVYSYPEGSLIRQKLDQALKEQHVSIQHIVPHRIDFVNSLIAKNYGVAFILHDHFHEIPVGSNLVVRPLSIPIQFQTGIIFKQGVRMTSAMKNMKSYLLQINN